MIKVMNKVMVSLKSLLWSVVCCGFYTTFILILDSLSHLSWAKFHYETVSKMKAGVGGILTQVHRKNCFWFTVSGLAVSGDFYANMWCQGTSELHTNHMRLSVR